MNQRYDAFGFGAALLAVALFVWAGLAGPIFQIDWRVMDFAAAAAWTQATVSVLAIVGVFVAAMLPIRATRKAKARENALRAGGMMLLILPELVDLLGAMQDARANGNIDDPPVLPSRVLLERADQLYL